MSALFQLFVRLPTRDFDEEFGLPTTRAIAEKRAEILCHHTAGLKAIVRRTDARKSRTKKHLLVSTTDGIDRPAADRGGKGGKSG